jgi:hypothetical protein
MEYQTSGSVELEQSDNHWRPLKWLTAVIFLVNWSEAFLIIHRHWACMRDHMGPVFFLFFFPFPCIFMFVRRRGAMGAAFPVTGVLFTYILLGMALSTMRALG